jgi:leader peptidase (prepilin peptidase)/N-methyltransferase
MNPTLLFALFAFIFGTIIGSFLNVLIYRIPRKLNFVTGRSMCPHCEHPLSALDLIPIVSFLALGRKCRYCHAPISWRYPAFEILTGLSFALVALRFGLSLEAFPIILIGWALSAVLITLSGIDLDTMEFDDGFSIAVALLAIAAIVLTNGPVTWHLVGAFAVSLPMLGIAMLTGGFGGADIKLMAAAGLLLGFPNILVAFMLGIIFGSIQAIILLRQGKSGKTMMPFGPHLALGIYLAFLYAPLIIQWYLGFFN